MPNLPVSGRPKGGYLSVAGWDRHLHKGGRRWAWIKSYVRGDTDGRRGLDDHVLTGLPDSTRLLFEMLLKLAGQSENVMPNDSTWIAGQVSMRSQDVGRGIRILLENGYLEHTPALPESALGDLQLPLPRTATPGSDLPHTSATLAPHLPQTTPHTTPHTRDDSAQPSGTDRTTASSAASTAASARAREKQEQEKEKEKALGNASVSYTPPAALPGDKNGDRHETIVGRIIALAARNDPASADTLRNVCHGQPDAVLARALESFLGRKPRPTNPAGYLVNAIRHIAADYGRNVAKITREPEL